MHDSGVNDSFMNDRVAALVEQVFEHFNKKRWTLSFAESCTGGLLSGNLARRPGISSVFIGSCVTYANSAKELLLGVPSELIKSHGAVSAPVALAMAHNVRKSLKSSWAVSITGIAGPTGGTPDKPVGTVHFGIAGPSIEATDKQLINGDRKEIQNQAVEHALRFLLEKSK